MTYLNLNIIQILVNTYTHTLVRLDHPATPSIVLGTFVIAHSYSGSYTYLVETH